MKKNWMIRIGTMLMAVLLFTAATAVPASAENYVKLRIWSFGYTSTSEDMEIVSEAVSKITREKLGVEVEIRREGDGEKLNLAMNSGEQWDLVMFHAFSGGLPTLVTNGMATPLDELVAEYGQEAAAIIGEDMMAAGKIGGVQYSMPVINVNANAYGLAIYAEVLDELGIDPESVKTWDDAHEMLLKIKEAHPDKYPIVTAWAGGGMQKAFAWDNLGTGFWDGLGILEDCATDSTTVVNMYETESYRTLVERMYQWNQEGLLMPDAVTTSQGGGDLIPSIGYATFENISPMKRQEMAAGTYWGEGRKGYIIELVPPFIDSNAGNAGYIIPFVSDHAKEAMQLLNLMYQDADIMNIVQYGIEGRDYEIVDGAAQVIAGSTYGPMGWVWPNQSISLPSVGLDKDIWEKNLAFDASASAGPAIGFKFDNLMVMNEITACSNVIAKYEVALRWGQMEPTEGLKQFNEELYAAGLQTIIDEKQRQLDAFLGK